MRNYFPVVLLGVALAGCGQEAPKSPPAPPPTAQPAIAPPAPPDEPPAVAASAFDNKTCPVTGDPIDPNTAATVTHEGKTYGFCCEECVEPFKKNPGRFTKAP